MFDHTVNESLRTLRVSCAYEDYGDPPKALVWHHRVIA